MDPHSALISSVDDHDGTLSVPLDLPLLGRRPSRAFNLAWVFRSLFPSLRASFLNPCRWPLNVPLPATTSTSSARTRLTGTFFGQKRGRVSFAAHEDPRLGPALLLELAIPTSQLVKEMASGMVRILLECDKSTAATCATSSTTTINKRNKKQTSWRPSLWNQPVWTMYCNGRRCGYAVSRRCTASDFHVLGALRAVSVGAGVLPAPPLAPSLPPAKPLEMGKGSYKDDCFLSGGGAGCEVMYMRAKFERVVGSRDSEAFYMINPDAGGRRGCDLIYGGPELSIFLLRM